MKAEVLSYSRSRGLFAGISLEGSTLRSGVYPVLLLEVSVARSSTGEVSVQTLLTRVKYQALPSPRQYLNVLLLKV